ncbi:EF-hand domain-containing protein [Nafulsella turpanensis]|uniref:hypothetical protein n=1 Tax=Nafulsella turpanensis TaxID=1265690 RepID=UPI000347C3AE|nr:hypothetical protein [Nafulsella turpanensis]
MKIRTFKIKNRKPFSLQKLGTLFTIFLFSWGAISCDAGSGVDEDDSIAEETAEINKGLEEQPEWARDDVQNLGNDVEEVEEGEIENDEGAVEGNPITPVTEEAFYEWDKDNDRRWNSEEFRSRVENVGLYEEWNMGNDEVFSENEFHGSYFDEWDDDNDGYLESDEYRVGYRDWRDDYAENFTEWDLNQDNRLELAEYEAGMRETGLVDEWDVDRDGNLTEDEVNTGIFNSWDQNGDGYLEFDEYNEVDE